MAQGFHCRCSSYRQKNGYCARPNFNILYVYLTQFVCRYHVALTFPVRCNWAGVHVLLYFVSAVRLVWYTIFDYESLMGLIPSQANIAGTNKLGQHAVINLAHIVFAVLLKCLEIRTWYTKAKAHTRGTQNLRSALRAPTFSKRLTSSSWLISSAVWFNLFMRSISAPIPPVPASSAPDWKHTQEHDVISAPIPPRQHLTENTHTHMTSSAPRYRQYPPRQRPTENTNTWRHQRGNTARTLSSHITWLT